MSAEISPDTIWEEDIAKGRQADVLNRRNEAEQLIAYIESVVGRDTKREDKRAYTIAVDAPYGQGKTFFLRRLAEHLALEHPVAYVDAWSDDLTDEPLTALIATLKSALNPLLKKPEVKKKFSDVMTKAGKVAKIVGWGLVRRGASFAITEASVHAAEDVLSGLPQDLKDRSAAGIKDVSEGAVEDTAETVSDFKQHTLLEKRISQFEECKAAVQNMKHSLEGLVKSLDTEVSGPPIIIVIDELDRCRPTYAVRLLEEIKHLFDVPGLVFILGLHGEQLGHSVSGAYGSGFDGRGYLKRFIDREYRLAPAKLTPLLDTLCSKADINTNSICFPRLAISQVKELQPSLPEILAEYMLSFGLGARDAFQLVDIMQTSLAISRGHLLHLPYFLPLVIGLLQGLPMGKLPKQVRKSEWVFIPNWSQINPDATQFNFNEIAERFQHVMQMSHEEIEQAQKNNRSDYAIRIVSDHRQLESEAYPNWSVFGYPQLLGEVSRFKLPQIE